MEAARVLETGEGLCLASVGTVWVSLFGERATASQIARIRSYVEEATPGSGGGLHALVILTERALSSPPDAAMREALRRLVAELPPRGAAIVIEGHGLRARAVRLILAGLMRLARGSRTARSFEDVEGAARFLAQATDGGGPSESEILAAVRMCRTAITPRVD